MKILQYLIFSLSLFTIITATSLIITVDGGTTLDCISFDPVKREITVTCTSASLSKVYDTLGNDSLIMKESEGIWLLNANLKIWHDSTFYINTTDTKWLKLNSTTPEDISHIYVVGNLKIDSVKLSSWNATSDNYALTKGNVPRASITILPEGTRKTDFTNSEISYLGDAVTPRGQGISYWSGDKSIIVNNTIHHMYYGFYSEGIRDLVIQNNTVHDDVKYGIDPHTGTSNLIIKNNLVHDNGHIGIICSVDCNNLTISGNKVSNNENAGIMLSKNVRDSIVSNNSIQNETTGISVSESSSNKVYDNNALNNVNGIQIKANSSSNTVNNNNIHSSERCGIEISKNSSGNVITSNSITNTTKYGICLADNPFETTINNNTIDAASGPAVYIRNSNFENNVFKFNNISNAIREPIKLVNGTLKVLNNTVNFKP